VEAAVVPEQAEAILRERGWTLNEKGYWVCPHPVGVIERGAVFTFLEACTHEAIIVASTSAVPKPEERFTEREPVAVVRRAAPHPLASGVVYRDEHGFYGWDEFRGELGRTVPTADAVPFPADLPEHLRPTPPPPPPPPPVFGSYAADRAAEELGLVRVEEVTRPEREETIRRLAHEAKTIISGATGSGKSRLAEELAVSLTTGTPCFGLPEFEVTTEPKRVLLLQTEMDDDEMDYRLRTIYAERGLTDERPTDLIVPSQARACTLDISVGEDGTSPSRTWIENAIRQVGIDVVIFDPFYDFTGSADITADRSGEMAGIMKWCAALDATVYLVVMGGTKLADIYGTRFLDQWVEHFIGCARRDVRGHTWSDFDFHTYPKRFLDRFEPGRLRLRGKGAEGWEVREPKPQVEAEAGADGEADAMTREEKIAVVRTSMAEEPKLSLEERSEKTGIPKTTLYRLMKKIEEET
jgi:AAA domain